MTTRNRNTNRKARETQTPALIAYHVAERGEKSFWTRIGAARDHEDAKGLTLQLELMPVNGGRIVLREASEEDGQAGEGEDTSAVMTMPRLRRARCEKYVM